MDLPSGLTPFFSGQKEAILHGDSLEVLRAFPPNTFTACVTDPPYGLEFMGKEWDSFRGEDRGEDEPVRLAASRRFQRWAEEWGREVLRVLVPGAPLFAFGGTRMFHRLTSGLEDAGFEIRDCVAWLYSQGFPKSYNLAKGLDGERVEDREAIYRVTGFIREARDRAGLTNEELDRVHKTNGMAGHWTSKTSQPQVPTMDQWPGLKAVLGCSDEMDEEIRRLNERKGTKGETFQKREVVGEYGRTAPVAVWRYRYGEGSLQDPAAVTVAYTEEARRWEGWGTCLKPAWEPIILAMKPMPGTYLRNLKEHGVAGLHVDGGKLDPRGENESGWSKTGSKASENRAMSGPNYARDPKEEAGTGRWPPNVAHDGSQDVVDLFPVNGSPKAPRSGPRGGSSWHGQESLGSPEQVGRWPGDEGGSVARFFYCAKPSAAERGTGNDHPTVKPVALMRWLLRLVSYPERNLVLDPFMGSGSTLVAASEEFLPVVGVERDESSCRIAAERLRGKTLSLF